MIPAILILVIVIASFAPPPLRGIVIILTGGLGIWYTTKTYTPYTNHPPMPDTPAEEKGDDLIQRYGLEKSIDHSDPLRKVIVEAVHSDNKPKIKK